MSIVKAETFRGQSADELKAKLVELKKEQFNLCEWGRHDPKVWLWGSHVAQSWRCGGDHGPTWRSTSDIIHGRTQIPPELGGKPYAWNDMDVRRPSDPHELCCTRGWTAWRWR